MKSELSYPNGNLLTSDESILTSSNYRAALLSWHSVMISQGPVLIGLAVFLIVMMGLLLTALVVAACWGWDRFGDDFVAYSNIALTAVVLSYCTLALRLAQKTNGCFVDGVQATWLHGVFVFFVFTGILFLSLMLLCGIAILVMSCADGTVENKTVSTVANFTFQGLIVSAVATIFVNYIETILIASNGGSTFILYFR
jgi:hypothetical protein